MSRRYEFKDNAKSGKKQKKAILGLKQILRISPPSMEARPP